MGLPDFDKLVGAYPQGPAASPFGVPEIAKLVGGDVGKNLSDTKYVDYKDTCAIRISRALNYGGAPIAFHGGGLANPFGGNGKIRTDKGGDGKWYIYSTYDMRAYLNAKFGKGKSFDGGTRPADLSKYKGIIAFGFYHLDLWTGTAAVHKEYFGNPKAKELIIWSAP